LLRQSGSRGPAVIRFTSAGQARLYRGGLFLNKKGFVDAQKAACAVLVEQEQKTRVSAALHNSEKARLKKILEVCARWLCTFTRVKTHKLFVRFIVTEFR
jgi:predicted type IV restriction endonuclease